jgi:ABC-type antimicrobial peptide transport system permease subunit
MRMALGANSDRLLRLVLKQGSRQVAIGLVLGFGLAFTLAALARATIANTLYGVGALDPLTYVSVLALVIAASTVALLLPARRAARVDPMVALRAE